MLSLEILEIHTSEPLEFDPRRVTVNVIQRSKLLWKNITQFDFQLVKNRFQILEGDVLLLTFKILDSVNCHGR